MKALVIDDHSLFCDGMEMLLTTRLSFDHVFIADNADEAMEMLENNTDIKLVLLDYKLGEDHGIDVLARIKANFPSTVVAVVSGFENPKYVTQCLGEGAAGYIPKTLKPGELADAITKVMQGHVYVPPVVRKDVENTMNQAQQKRDMEIAEATRKIIRQKDFSQRLPNTEDSEVVSAFNSLLAELEKDRSNLIDLAFKDVLTGVANRRLFLDRAESALKQSARSGTLLALAYLDLDSFKQLNDTHGHDAGDFLLIEVANRLLANVREVDTVARLGGDEFTIVFQSVSSGEVVREIAERIFKALQKPVQLPNGNSWSPSVSIGIVLSRGDERLATLLKRADKVLYDIKHSGKNQYCVMGEA